MSYQSIVFTILERCSETAEDPLQRNCVYEPTAQLHGFLEDEAFQFRRIERELGYGDLTDLSSVRLHCFKIVCAFADEFDLRSCGVGFDVIKRER